MDIVQAMERSLTQRGLSPRARPRARGLRARTGSGALSRRAARSAAASRRRCVPGDVPVRADARARAALDGHAASPSRAEAPFAAVPSAQGRGAPHLGLELLLQPRSVRPRGNGTILVTAAGQSTSTPSAASTRPSSASTCRSRRPCRVLPSPPPRAQAHRHRPRSKQLGAQRSVRAGA